MPATAGIVLRPYEDRDLEGTLELRPQLYPGWAEANDRDWHVAVFEWLARSPAKGTMHRWVLDRGGRIVGHLAAAPLPYRIGGRSVVAHTPTDYMALPGNGFHAVNLMRTFFQACESYVACNVVGDVSRIEGMFGSTEVARLTHALKPLDVGAYPRLPARVPRLAARAASAGLRAVDAVLGGVARGGMRIDEEPVEAIDERFDVLFERVAAAVPATVERSSEFLLWRYGPGTPRGPMRLLTVTLRASGELGGYALLRTTEKSEGFVLDLTTLPGRPDLARGLLAEAVRRFWADRAFVVRYRYLPSVVSPAPRDVRRLGFAIRNQGGGLPGIAPERQLQLLARFGDPATQAVAGSRDAWAYNLGDGEASFWVH